MRLRLVAGSSLLLLFFTVPHTLEDFATGEPAAAGVPAPLLAFVVATAFFVQALGLYWLGRQRRSGLLLQAAVGLFWPVASGFAQLPALLSEGPYRAGIISVTYVVGTIAVGILLFAASVAALAATRSG